MFHSKSSDYLSILNKSSILYSFFTSTNKDIYFIYSKIKNINSGIYCIFTLHNSKVYIGSTKNFQKRLRRHREELKKNKHFSKYLQNSFNKYGIDNLKFFILEEVENLEECELKWIRYFDSVNCGYNAVENTQRNFHNQSLINNNIKRTSKSVIALNLEGEFVKEFSSISEAARYYNTQSTNISKCCKGGIRYIKNHIFIYKDNYDGSKCYKLKPIDYSYRKNDDYRLNMSLKNKGKVISELQKISSSEKQGIKIYCETHKLTFRSLKETSRYYNICSTSIKRSIEKNRLCKNLKFLYI